MRLILNEKPNQSADFAKALGATDADIRSGKPKGFIEIDGGKTTIAWCYGHMLELAPPAVYFGVDPKEDPHPHWKDPASLPFLPEKLILEPIEKTAKQLTVIGRLLKRAKEVVIAGDCDNEGELIQREVLDHFKWSGKTLRALFNTQDGPSIRKAMASLVPASETILRAEAAAARRDADWLIGMNLSPAATKALVPNGVPFVFPIGRVKSAVQRIVFDRDMAIEQFKPQPYFEIAMTVTTSDGQSVVLTYAPKERMTDAAEAETVLAAARGFSGPLWVETKRKRSGPPRLFARSDLEMAAARELKMSLANVETALQPLYDHHKYVTYPRTNGRHLNEGMVGEVPTILKHLASIDTFASHIPADPVIRKGKDGTFSDKALEKASHHAIVPSASLDGHLRVPDLTRLSDLERRLYLLIARRYLEQFLPDYVFDSTTITAKAGEFDFKASGSVMVEPGWKILGGKSDDDTEKEGTLAAIANGSGATATAVKRLDKTTEPPKRFTEASLIAEMLNAAKYVKNPALAKMLEDAEGIGTEATRKDIIGELFDRDLLEKQKTAVVTTDATRAQVPAVLGVAPEVMDPGMSALFEENARRIVDGTMTRGQHRQMVDKWLSKQCQALRAASPLSPAAFGAAGKPSARQVSLAETVSRSLKLALPSNVKTSGPACGAFLDQHMPAYEEWRKKNPAPAKSGFSKGKKAGAGARRGTGTAKKTGSGAGAAASGGGRRFVKR